MTHKVVRTNIYCFAFEFSADLPCRQGDYIKIKFYLCHIKVSKNGSLYFRDSGKLALDSEYHGRRFD